MSRRVSAAGPRRGRATFGVRSLHARAVTSREVRGCWRLRAPVWTSSLAHPQRPVASGQLVHLLARYPRRSIQYISADRSIGARLQLTGRRLEEAGPREGARARRRAGGHQTKSPRPLVAPLTSARRSPASLTLDDLRLVALRDHRDAVFAAARGMR